MADALTVLGIGFALGLSLAMPPGPILALSAERTVTRGYWPGVVVALGATAGDATHAVLMGFGIMPLVAGQRLVLALLTLGGAFLMAWFAWNAWRAARRPPDLTGQEEPAQARGFARLGVIGGGFATGYALALTSPYNFAWWLGAGTNLFRDYGLLVFVSFFAAIVGWSFVFAALVLWTSGRVKGIVRGVSYASAFGLGLFALRLLYVGGRDLAALL